jgi:dTDP-4-amino-4,6-dideoxygalactose transaminase
VHYGGQPVDDRLFQLGVPVIEDCAHAVGCPAVAVLGRSACYSFQAVKHIGTPDGGMLVIPESLAAKAKRLRWAGIDREAKHAGTWENDIREVGYKYQMNDVAAAMALEGLKSLDWQVTYRRARRDSYRSKLRGLDGIQVIDQDPRSACWLMTVLVDRREDLMRKLREDGVECDLVHYRNDRYTIFKEFRRPGGFPNMDAMEGKYLVLPLHMGMDVGDVARICEVIRSGW